MLSRRPKSRTPSSRRARGTDNRQSCNFMLRHLYRRAFVLETNVPRLDKRANGCNEVEGGLCAERFGFVEGFQMIELVHQLALVERNVNSTLLSEPPCGCELMIVSLFAHTCSARHNYN